MQEGETIVVWAGDPFVIAVPAAGAEALPDLSAAESRRQAREPPEPIARSAGYLGRPPEVHQTPDSPP